MSTIGIDIRNIGKKRTGDEVVFFNLVKNLAVIDRDNDYKLFTDIADTDTLDSVKKNLGVENKSNFEIISLKTANKFTWNFWTIQRYLRKNPVDIYLTQYITPFFVPKKIKIATIIHDVSFKVYRQFIKFSDLFFLDLLIPRSFRRADKIVAVSRFTRDEIIKYYDVQPEKVDWIHNAVSADYLAQGLPQERLDYVRHKYKLPRNFILYIGTLQPRKNVPTLIEAFAKISPAPLSDKTSDISPQAGANEIGLVVAGGKSHNFDEKIDEAVKKNNLENRVVFPGFIDEEDKAAVMKSANVFCFPSFYEGFGIPILEAMSVGTPTVVSAIAPHQEIAEDAALYFDPENTKELAERISSIISDENLRQELIQKGLQQVKKFSWEKTARKLLVIFEDMK